MRAFFKYPPKNWAIGQIGRICCKEFWVVLSVQILSLCIPSPMILHYSAIFFCQKLIFSYILPDFLFGIRIWIWFVENLRISHHASIVRGLTYDYDDSYLVSFLLLFLVKVALITYILGSLQYICLVL